MSERAKHSAALTLVAPRSSETPETADPFQGLECSLGKARIAVPARYIQQILEYEVSLPPPLARKWLGGLAIVHQKVAVSISLLPSPTGFGTSRQATGLLLRVPEQECAWLLEVSKVLGLGHFELQDKARAPEPKKELPAWMKPAHSVDKRSVAWIDVPAMMRELVGAA